MQAPGQDHDSSEDAVRDPSEAGGTVYRLRVDLDDTHPPVWRRIEVPSRLTLDHMHEVLQIAFGWTDSHLHRFETHRPRSGETRYYLAPFDVAEGDEGTPEERVRLDEVMGRVGDRLHYRYDFGDDWGHTLRLEAKLTEGADATTAVCTAGARPGPPEDCGGVHGYELMVAVSDPDHPAHAESVREFADIFGYELEPSDTEVIPFDKEAVNRELAALDLATRMQIGQVPDAITELLQGVFDPQLRGQLFRLVADAEFDEPAPVDPDTAARMMHPYRWLLERVGDEGIKLTGAGYLPPVHVAAAFTELRMDEQWIGAGNRESETLPVLRLRETAQELGLLRKYRGRLSVTKRGRALTDDPVALWRHVTDRLPLHSRDEAVRQAGLVLLLWAAAGSSDDPRPLVASVLTARGWRHGDGTPLNATTVGHILWDNLEVLRRVGAVERDTPSRWPGVPTSEGVTFARAALQP